MADEPEVEVVAEEEVTCELYLGPGEFWCSDVYALQEALKFEGLSNDEGVVVAFIRGKGAVNLADLIKAWKPERGSVTQITGGKK